MMIMAIANFIIERVKLLVADDDDVGVSYIQSKIMSIYLVGRWLYRQTSRMSEFERISEENPVCSQRILVLLTLTKSVRSADSHVGGTTRFALIIFSEIRRAEPMYFL